MCICFSHFVCVRFVWLLQFQHSSKLNFEVVCCVCQHEIALFALQQTPINTAFVVQQKNYKNANG